MVSHIVLMASHISSIERIETIKFTLQSLANQKVRPQKVCISYSCESNLKCNANEWIKAIYPIPLVISYKKEKTLQFRHFQSLLIYVENSDIVSFIDDDDLMHPDKISLVNKLFQEHPDTLIVSHKMATFGTSIPFEHNKFETCQKAIAKSVSSDVREYCCKSIKGSLLKDWFTNCSKYVSFYKDFDSLLEDRKGLTDLAYNMSIADIDEQIMINDILLYVRKQPIIRAYTKVNNT